MYIFIQLQVQLQGGWNPQRSQSHSQSLKWFQSKTLIVWTLCWCCVLNAAWPVVYTGNPWDWKLLVLKTLERKRKKNRKKMTVTIVSQWWNQCHCVPVSVGILPVLSASCESYDLSILNKAALSKRWVQEKTEFPHWHCTPTLRNGINDNYPKRLKRE